MIRTNVLTNYTFSSGKITWVFHILIGLAFLGYGLFLYSSTCWDPENIDKEHSENTNFAFAIIMSIVGALAILYHGYLMYYIKQTEYSIGVPGKFIWLGHILVGVALLVYAGYVFKTRNDSESNPSLLHFYTEEMNIVKYFFATLFIIIGSLAAMYHGHLWYIQN